MSLTLRSTLSTLCATITALSVSITAQAYDGVVFFGDSLSDGGYFRPALVNAGANPNQVGEFTTNPDHTWTSHLATALGTTSTPDIPYANQQGNNFAIGGARAGVNESRMGLPIFSARQQVDTYLARGINPNALHVLWIGANDLFAAGENPANAQSIILDAINAQVESINKLHQAGAKYILVPNLPDVGLTPAYVNTPQQALGTNTAKTYNDIMLARANVTGANVIVLDTFSLLQQVAANPSSYGISNMTATACGTTSSLTCNSSTLVSPDAANTYFFADGVHPTGAAHAMIAEYANAVLQAPSHMASASHLAHKGGHNTLAQLQSHIQGSSDQNSPYRAWVAGSGSKGSHAGMDLDGSTALMAGVDFHANAKNSSTTGIYLSHAQHDHKGTSAVSRLNLRETGAGIYHSTQIGAVNVNAGIHSARLQLDSQRDLRLGKATLPHEARADGSRHQAHIQAGWRVNFGSGSITPYVGASAQRVVIDALVEQGGSATAMRFDEQKSSQSLAKVGVQAEHALGTTARLFGDVHYQKVLSDSAPIINARLNSQPALRFSTPALNYDDDALSATLGVAGRFGKVDAQAGIRHNKGDADNDTSVFASVGTSF